jgi:protein-disulfide isomerase
MKRLIAALMISALPASALDLSAMTEDERAAFGAAVRSYLMENPQVLVEAINELEARQVAEAARSDQELASTHAEALFQDGASWIGGNPEGSVEMAMFIDYRCGVCRQFNAEVLDAVEEDGDIRLVMKEFPILGPESEMASRFAVAVLQAAGDEAYLAAHNALMEMRGQVSEDSLRQIAGRIGVDADDIVNRMETESVTAVLRANRELADAMAIQGTPTFVIGDQMLRGMPRDGLGPTIAAVRAEG